MWHSSFRRNDKTSIAWILPPAEYSIYQPVITTKAFQTDGISVTSTPINRYFWNAVTITPNSWLLSTNVKRDTGEIRLNPESSLLLSGNRRTSFHTNLRWAPAFTNRSKSLCLTPRAIASSDFACSISGREISCVFMHLGTTVRLWSKMVFMDEMLSLSGSRWRSLEATGINRGRANTT